MLNQPNVRSTPYRVGIRWKIVLVRLAVVAVFSRQLRGSVREHGWQRDEPGDGGHGQ